MTLDDIMADDRRKQQFVLANVLLDRAEAIGWYDAAFLHLFEAARSMLARTNPSRIDDFVAAFAPLRTDPGFRTRHERNFLSEDQYRNMVDRVRSLRVDQFKRTETSLFGRSIVHDLPALAPLHRALADWVSGTVGEPVVPAYSFLSRYTNQGVLTPHLDQPISKWTIDICIEQNVLWPIHLSRVIDWPTIDTLPTSSADLIADADLAFQDYTLEPNGALLFSGSAQWHHRHPMPAVDDGYCTLIFLHYHPAGCEALVDPARWADHFDLPELAVLNVAHRWRSERAAMVKSG